MCFAAKWVGRKGVEFWSDLDGHQTMIQKAWDLLNEADAVLHYNGARFDIPHLQREFMEAGFTPPSPFKQIDLLKTARTKAKFLSNKLAFVAPRLGQKGKVKHEGFGLWLKCMDGDEAAWKRMRSYNIRDVTELEELYTTLLPWITTHPSHGAQTGTDVCPRCGSEERRKDGFYYTAIGKFQQYQCKVCGGWSKDSKRLEATSLVAV